MLTRLIGSEGSALSRAIDDLEQLLELGETESELLRDLEPPRTAGFWYDSDSGERFVATSRLVRLMEALPRPREAVAAVLSMDPEIRMSWNRILLARLQEIGQRRDTTTLCEAITALGSLAAELSQLPAGSLAPTPFVELERLALPAPAHDAPAYPVLLRVLSATAALPAMAPGSARPLPEVEWDDPAKNWVLGRLLQLPGAAGGRFRPRTVLSGDIAEGPEAEAMKWVLPRPWAFLFAQFVFTQEAWSAERVAGGLALEIEPSQAGNFERPQHVDVIVSLPGGEEVRCGSLGEFVKRVTAELGITLLGHRVSPQILDERFGAVVEAVLRRDVWRFNHGSGGRRPGYQIHPSFSDACYRALGSRAFYRLGASVTAAIRRAAELWARERTNRTSKQPEEAA